jgi:AraC-like DNA-binding protein
MALKSFFGANAMNVIALAPRPPLDEFIELLWLCRRTAVTHRRERVLPMGSIELVVHLGDNGVGPLVCGPHSQPMVIDASAPATIAGVHFKPGGAYPFLKLPIRELHNGQTPLRWLWGAAADALHDRLLAAKNPAQIFRVLQRALLDELNRPQARSPAVAFALRELGGGLPSRSITELADHVGLSSRRFIQAFSDEVGLTPKLFGRVARFQRALRLIDADPQPEWSALALTCGYYDQSHLIHDFRDFCRLSPAAYLIVRGEHLNHIPLLD